MQPGLRTTLGPQLAVPGFTPWEPASPTAWTQKQIKKGHLITAQLPCLCSRPRRENHGSFSSQLMAIGQKTGCL